MHILQNLPIRQKLMLIALLTTGGALVMAGAALIYFDVTRFRAEMTEDLGALTEIVANNCTAALAFRDDEAAAETLRALRARQDIVSAAVYDGGGRLVASYGEKGDAFLPAEARAADGHTEPGGLGVFRPVVLKGERIGTVYLRGSRDELMGRIRVHGLTVGVVFLASGLASLLLASGLQRIVSQPILDLSETARAVSERQSYALRATKAGADEMGDLVDAFNSMLEQIQERDSALLKAKGELERRVEERTLELAQRNDELAQSNKELDDFAYIASHDLKEPLRGIHNYSSFLLEDYAGKLDAEGRSKLETLMRLTRRMETLIDSLLHYSRLGRVDLAIDRVDLNEIVAEVLDSLAITLKQEETEVRIPRPLPTVRCDRARVGEIFSNLVVNAMRYNDKPRKWIEIGVIDGEELPVFYVRDNGIGISEKHHDAVFRIFKRLHGRDKFGGGTGAGLTIVKKIVERHQGRIWLESSPGEGTTFFFTLREET